MNANKARQITAANLRGHLIQPLLETAYERIKLFAEDGQSSVTHPFHGAKDYPTTTTREAALNHLRNEGYTIKHHSDPDPGDPRSQAYDEVSW